MQKKVINFVSSLNIISAVLFIVSYIEIRLDILPADIRDILPTGAFTFIWVYLITGGIALLFTAVTIIRTIKDKKLPTDFYSVLCYFLNAILIVFIFRAYQVYISF